jgi:hypothetical protein
VKPAYFVCLLLFIAAPIFISGQSRDFSLVPQSPAGVLPSAGLDAKAKAAIRSNYGKLPLPFGMQRQPFSVWHGYSPSSRRSVRRSGLQSAVSTLNPIFLEAPTYSVGGESGVFFAAADVNRDGKLDLVVPIPCTDSNCDGAVGVLLGNGDGTLQAVVDYPSGGGGTQSVAVADVNGDGKPDLIVGNECSANCGTGSVSVLLGNGDGTFQAAVSYGAGGYASWSVAVADVNGDGKPDLLVANYCANDECETDGSVGVLLGNGDGTFQPAVTYDSGGYHAFGLAVKDVNGDGKPDLLVANNCIDTNCANGSVSVLLGNGNGTFGAANSYSSGGYEAQSIAVADVNKDGKPDLVVGNAICLPIGACETGSVGVLLGNGDGTFQPVMTYGGSGAQSVAVADVNGDGKPDVIVATCGDSECATGAVGLLLGNGDGTFQNTISYDSSGTGATSVAVGDVNGDGRPDLLVSNDCGNYGNYDCTTGTVGVLLNKGKGAFSAALNYNSGGYKSLAVAVADLNGDGKPDMVATNWAVNSDNSAGIVGVLLGNGNGTFQTTVGYGTGGYIADFVAVADVNGDGKPDIIVANHCVEMSCDVQTGNIGVLLGNGNGTFQPAASYNLDDIPNSVAVADVNGDGKPDLLVAVDSGISVLLNNGNDTFTFETTYSSGGDTATSVAVADVNGDGKPDLLVTNNGDGTSSSGSVSVLFGNGDGTFQPAVTYSSGAIYTDALAIGDVNGDGKIDLVVASQYTNAATAGAVSVLLGNGDGTFQSPIITVTPTPLEGVTQLALTDFNGDGKLDLAIGAGDVLLLGNGNGTFQPPIVLGANGPGIAFGDFNRDGKPDLAVCGVTVLLNDAANFKYATTTLVTSSLNPAPPGAPVTFTATVTPAFTKGSLTGRVSFYDGATLLGSGSLSDGKATLSKSNLALGSHSITATFAGGGNYLPSTSSVLIQLIQGPVAVISPASLNFGNQPIGTKSLPKKITLNNKGNAALSITTIAVTGGDAADFTQTNGCGTTVAAGANCSIMVTFRPAATGSLTADIAVTDNSGGSPQKVTLSGTGTFITSRRNLAP